jgi:signal transduction histidine kinase
MTPSGSAGAYRGGMNAMGRLHRAARRQPHADIAIAALLYAVTLLTTAAGPPPARGRLDPAAVIVAAIACGALVARRWRPFPVLVASTLAAEAYMAPYQGHEGTLVLAAPLIALYTVAETTGRRRALTIGALAILAIAGTHMIIKPANWLGAENVALAAFGALAVAAGDASRNRRAYLAEVEERANRAESDREQEARRRVTEERLRIARDLHDSVGHHLALINVEAGVTAHVLRDQPPQVKQALTNIRQASRSALDELRDTIGLLRQPDDQAAPTEPTTGLSGLAELIASFQRSGLHIDHDADSERHPLAPAADLTAYRVIQESLTNVCKHAGTATVRLHLDYQPAALHIVVDNDNDDNNRDPRRPYRGPTPHNGDASGHGILGMRERVAALGGSLHAGPRPGGGFRVTATLPLKGGTP